MSSVHNCRSERISHALAPYNRTIEKPGRISVGFWFASKPKSMLALERKEQPVKLTDGFVLHDIAGPYLLAPCAHVREYEVEAYQATAQGLLEE